MAWSIFRNPGGGVTPDSWSQAELARLGAPRTATNLRSLIAWELLEGGGGTDNPLNTTLPEPGATDFNAAGVKNYTSYEQGLRATTDTLASSSYTSIVRDLKSGRGLNRGNIPGLSTWSGGGYSNVQPAWGAAQQYLHGGGVVPGNTIPYRNPFRAVQNLQPERVDMGVDYSGTGDVYALGPGVITGVNTSWAGGVGAVGPGTYISERLTAGPLKGHEVYVAENISPIAYPGEHVTADTKIGQMTGGIETGLAAPGQPGALGETLAAYLHQQSPSGDPGAWSTASGEAYSKILHAVGAPAGKLTDVGKGLSGSIHGTDPSWLRIVLNQIIGNTVSSGGTGVNQGLGGIGDALGRIATVLEDVQHAIDWFINPANWVRILAGMAGVTLTITGIITMARTGKPYSVNVPVAGQVPTIYGGQIAPAIGIAEVTIGAILLFVAFHNLPSDVTSFSSLLGYFSSNIRHPGSEPAQP